MWFTSLYGVSLSQRFCPWLSQKSLMKKELGPEKESQRRYKQYYHYSEKNTITTARKKTTLNWQRTGHLWVRKVKLPFLYEVHRIFKIKFEKYFLSAKFPSAVTFHIYLYPCNFFFFLHTTLDVLLMQRTQSFSQNETIIVGYVSKINSKDKYYYLKSRNHFSSNLLK